MVHSWKVIVLVALSSALVAQAPAEDQELQHSVEALRSSIGRWDVVTEFLKRDGSVARSVTGTYEFSWILADRVVSGKSAIPELKQAAGILFYINEKKRVIEMVSVGADGNLWIMTGPLGEEYRLTQEFPNRAGGTRRLRFTRFNVTPNTFESKMEYTDDGGQTWVAGNHQRFSRLPASEQ